MRQPDAIGRAGRAATAGLVVLAWAGPSLAQDPQPPAVAEVHEHVEVAGTLLTPTTDGSGTAWLPRATPMYGVHREWRSWDLRADGSVFAQLVYEEGERHRTGGAAERQATSINWAMAMARRKLGPGRFGVRTMLSADPWTVTDCGSLDYLATGEICDGDTIHDRQQPHDLVMELAADYDGPIRSDWRWRLYAGLAGEPAFGPTAYPHRPSAAPNPLAPVSHHWLDATHSAFGVVTLGTHTPRWKAEASAFRGRAPDERRSDLDLGAFDSAAARVSYLPTDRIALQVSVARISDARAMFERQPDPKSTRFSASATYHRLSGERDIWASTLAFGTSAAREVVSGGLFDGVTSAGLIETSLTLAARHTLFGRAEIASMPGHHLHAQEYARTLLAVAKLQAGYVRQFGGWLGLVPGIGGSFALSILPAELAPRYGGRTAPSLAVFFNLRPRRHAME
jgi:hypothetical protein